ncbi:MAG TPA: ribonuclease E/G [Caulobacteraceae bacterium]|jgi:Ribonuclease G/E
MSRAKLYLDRAPGETRGVLTLAGRPHRLLVLRDDDPDTPSLGRRYMARAARLDRGLASAFLDLGGDDQALLALSGDAKALVEGATVEIEIAAEARRGKLAQARLVGPGQGRARALTAPQALAERLQALAPGQPLIEGREARDAADQAEVEVLAPEHPLPGGGSLAIERTRALVAIDVDLGARAGDVRRIARQANLTAIDMAARLLRLKGLAGLIVIDLVGAGHDGAALTQAAKTAFAPDEPGVGLGPISRLGLLQIAIPWRIQPVAERLCDSSGAITPTTAALRLLRALEREGRADGGARLVGRCAPLAAQATAPYIPALTQSLGPRFEIRPDPALRLDQMEVSS